MQWNIAYIQNAPDSVVTAGDKATQLYLLDLALEGLHALLNGADPEDKRLRQMYAAQQEYLSEARRRLRDSDAQQSIYVDL